ncbi:hypothetical protein ERJ75_001664900 [Trypanosoma vivax]|uniref:Uncharacterized protein n=1 Tax=Trypanosoma vivax (strain Y486) TaxID=1055687 RepID=G0U8H4_TRYVY|nr:hypothetical protein TRVL_02544 [Trypanosoma vivax]KAH8605089.1 hypothetical protein ERJ75_001664900 [Trypanosoma vivax]CCC53900.1 conserved hypothetical protein [Trypanosoma vivax Y486]
MGDDNDRPSSRIRVHHAALYTQLMNAADWSITIERELEQQRQLVARREAEAAFCREQEQHKLEEARRRAEREAAIAETLRRRREAEELGQRQIQQFFLHLNDITQRQTDFVTKCSHLQHRNAMQRHRVLLRAARVWEDDVLRPIQSCIRTQMLDDAASRERSRKRHDMMHAYISECNRADKASSRVFRDIIDVTQYDPLEQLRSCTIQYPSPPSRGTVVEAHHREARKTLRQYESLARDYRALQLESKTGVLSDPSPCAATSQLLTLPILTDMRCQNSEAGTTADQERYSTRSQLVGSPALESANSRAHSSIHRPREERSTMQNLWAAPHSIHSCPQLPRIEPQGRVPSQAAAEIMPSLNGTEAESDQFIRWMKKNQQLSRTYSVDLPVTMWDRFTETMIGWKRTPEGRQRTIPNYRKEQARQALQSNIVFDHYNFQRGQVEPLRTGKRVL